MHVLARVQDFFLGLNAGTWLKIRMQQAVCLCVCVRARARERASAWRTEALLAADRAGGRESSAAATPLLESRDRCRTPVACDREASGGCCGICPPWMCVYSKSDTCIQKVSRACSRAYDVARDWRAGGGRGGKIQTHPHARPLTCARAHPEPTDDLSLYRVHTPQGLSYCAEVEEPPPDKAYLFDHWGAGGNTGVSGQQCLPAGAAPPTNTGEEEIGGGRAVGGGVGGGGEYVPWAYQPLVSEPAPKAR